jgi:hypothetical protein
MTERYFEKFRTIEYANTVAVDITQRSVFVTAAYNNPLFYYPYDIAQGERPDMIADRYYNDQYMSWLLYFGNKIVDPYYDWYLDPTTFDNFIVKKYGSLANAVNKIQFYRNNWYSDPNPTITADAYAVLDPSLTKFYEPVPINGVVTSSPTDYVRRRVDWTIQTNGIAKYGVANGSSFTTEEVVDVTFDTQNKGIGQVTFANTTTVFLNNLSGVVTTGTITANSTLSGRESRTTTVFTTAQSIANNIPAAEDAYWSPVTYYEYENELNEKNRSIFVLKAEYSTQAAKQLKTLLR